MALLVLAHRMLAGKFEVATVDHGLRPEAAEECALVARACTERGIECQVLRVQVGEGNLQDRARAARYSALGTWAQKRGLAAIATAHHADDQAETLLMRLNRGSGLAGLAGIRSSTRIEGCAVPVIRPLLHFRRKDLRDIVDGAEMPFVDDPSNRDESFDRVRLRRALESTDWIDPLGLSLSASHLEEAERALETVASRLWDREAQVSEASIVVPIAEATDIASMLVGRAIETLVGKALSRGEIASFLKTLDRRGNIAGVLIERQYDSFVCSPEPPRRSE